jgi:hypothetical protein
MATYKFSHFIATDKLYIFHRISCFSTLCDTCLKFIPIKLHLNHISLHFLFLFCMALLKLFKIINFITLVLLDLFTF